MNIHSGGLIMMSSATWGCWWSRHASLLAPVFSPPSLHEQQYQSYFWMSGVPLLQVATMCGSIKGTSKGNSYAPHRFQSTNKLAPSKIARHCKAQPSQPQRALILAPLSWSDRWPVFEGEPCMQCQVVTDVIPWCHLEALIRIYFSYTMPDRRPVRKMNWYL